MLVHGIQTLEKLGQGKWKMNDNINPSTNKNNVVQFPLKGVPDANIKIDNVALGLHEDLKFAEHLTEGLVVNLIHNLGENGIDTKDAEFIRDIGFTIELVKSLIYRDIGIKHPIQDLVQMFTIVEEEEDEDGMHTIFDIDALADFVGMTEEDGKDNED